MRLSFKKELYSKIALLKAAYNFTDQAFIHLDSDTEYYYVELKLKDNAKTITEDEFINEMLTQSIRHEVFLQTKNVRELLLARAMATTVVAETGEIDDKDVEDEDLFSENQILKDWYGENEGN